MAEADSPFQLYFKIIIGAYSQGQGRERDYTDLRMISVRILIHLTLLQLLTIY